MITIVAGTRDFKDQAVVDLAIASCGWKPRIIFHGACRGPDLLGADWARRNHLIDIPFPVPQGDWNKYGGGAGPRRNRRMVDAAIACANGNLDDVGLVVIWDTFSSGTGNVIDYAQSKGILVYKHIVPKVPKAFYPKRN